MDRIVRQPQDRWTVGHARRVLYLAVVGAGKGISHGIARWSRIHPVRDAGYHQQEHAGFHTIVGTFEAPAMLGAGRSGPGSRPGEWQMNPTWKTVWQWSWWSNLIVGGLFCWLIASSQGYITNTDTSNTEILHKLEKAVEENKAILESRTPMVMQIHKEIGEMRERQKQHDQQLKKIESKVN
jgi:hypothetical protein